MTNKNEEYRNIVNQYITRRYRKLKREPFILGDYVYVPLQDGSVAFTEKEYYELVNGCLWSKDSKGYVQGHHNYAPMRKMHRWLWHNIKGETPKGMIMDHINRNPLDNRLANLRLVTYAQSCRNVLSRSGTSKYPGVCWANKRGKWRAAIQYKGKKYSLGYYDTEEEAFLAYYAKAVEFGVESYIPDIKICRDLIRKHYAETN